MTKKMTSVADHIGENEMSNDWLYDSRPVLVEKEMGINRRKRRSIHGRGVYGDDFLGKIPASLNRLSPTTVYASCLDVNEENILYTIMEGCTNVEEMIKKLKDQTISLTKKKCIKAKLEPVRESKVFKLSFIKKLKYRISYGKVKLGFRNFLYTFELWYSSLKVIEGKFGSSVATYFKFLRKLFILNCIIFFLNFFFIILPQIFCVQFSKPQSKSDSANESLFEPFNSVKNVTSRVDNLLQNFVEEETETTFFFFTSTCNRNSSLRFGNLLTGMVEYFLGRLCNFVQSVIQFLYAQGYLTDSILFYGHYLNTTFSLNGSYAYDIPSAYFFSTAFCYFLVMCVLFFSVAESYKKCYIETAKGVQNVFAEKIFCGWDFGIAKRDAEELKYCSIYMELKELLHEASHQNDTNKCWDCYYTMMIRFSSNMIILLLLVALGWWTSSYLNMHMHNAEIPTLMMLMLTLTLITTLAPVCFSHLEKIEFYNCPRTAMYITLIRTFILHILIIIIIVAHRLNSASKMTCWETVVGQDIYRLLILDFLVGCADNMVEFIRSRMNKIWHRIPRSEFNIALNTMNLIYNQALLYVGLYFSPGLSFIVSVKMLLTFYLKKWGAMYNCQPSKKPWRSAHMQTVFLSFAFLVFFSVIIAYGYIFTSVKTSSCGPFGGGKYTFHAVLSEVLQESANSKGLSLFSHFFRSGVIIVILLGMILAIYYLRSINRVRRHIVKNLRSIVKEQVANKKKLLMKIRKAEEDLRLASRITKDRLSTKITCYIKDPSFSSRRRNSESSSDSDDSGGHSPLRSYYVPSCLTLNSNRLCKSAYNLGTFDNAYIGNSGKKVSSTVSLQNINSKYIVAGFPESSSCLHLSNGLEDFDDRDKCVDISVDENQGEENYELSLYNNNNGIRSDGLNNEVMTGQEEALCFNRRTYNYDERMPSRINFTCNRKICR